MIKHITYVVEEHDINSEYNYKFDSVWEKDWEFAARECAEDYFHNHDGWECSWPLTFQIRYEGKFVGSYEIGMEAVPSFYIERVIHNG